jgi:hypothetical protein
MNDYLFLILMIVGILVMIVGGHFNRRDQN